VPEPVSAAMPPRVVLVPVMLAEVVSNVHCATVVANKQGVANRTAEEINDSFFMGNRFLLGFWPTRSIQGYEVDKRKEKYAKLIYSRVTFKIQRYVVDNSGDAASFFYAVTSRNGSKNAALFEVKAPLLKRLAGL